LEYSFSWKQKTKQYKTIQNRNKNNKKTLSKEPSEIVEEARRKKKPEGSTTVRSERVCVAPPLKGHLLSHTTRPSTTRRESEKVGSEKARVFELATNSPLGPTTI